jgi:hypothetical protein
VTSYITDDQLINALSTDQFYICISLASFASRRVQAKSVLLDVIYFGSTPKGTLGKNTLTSATSGAGIAGAIIGGVLGVIALVSVLCVVTVLLLAYYVQRRSQVPVKQEARKIVEMQEVYTPPSTSTHVYDQLPTYTYSSAHNSIDVVSHAPAEYQTLIQHVVVPETTVEQANKPVIVDSIVPEVVVEEEPEYQTSIQDTIPELVERPTESVSVDSETVQEADSHLPAHSVLESTVTEPERAEESVTNEPEVVAQEQQPEPAIGTVTEQVPENVTHTVTEQEPESVIIEFPEVESKSENIDPQ